MNEKLKLKSEFFCFEKKEKKLQLFKELRDSAMKEYREEKDVALKSILLDAFKQAQDEYMKHLKSFK